MKSKKIYKNYLVNWIADEQMLADVLYSYNVRAKKYQEHLHKVRNAIDLMNTLASIEEVYTKKRDLLVKLFSDKIICIHRKKNMIEKVVFENDEEYNLIEGDADGKDFVWDEAEFLVLLNYKKRWVEECKYFLFFRVADKTFHCPVDKEKIHQSYSNVEIIDIDDNKMTYDIDIKDLVSLQFCNKVYDQFMRVPIEFIEMRYAVVEPAVKEDDIKKITPKTEEKIGYKTTKPHKRGYNIPVYQYKKVAIFDTIDVAAATTGIEVDAILVGIDTQPSEAVSYIWKYTNKSKTKVAQYELLHTYKNQNDINTQSFEVCGKKISHTNVAPKLKEWKQVSKEEFVWIRLAA